MRVQIRESEEAELWGIVKVQYASEHELELGFLPDYIKDSVLPEHRDLINSWNKRFKNPAFHTIVAINHENSHVLGFIAYEYYKGNAYIRSFYMKPGADHHGIGTILLKHALLEISKKNVKKILLEVLSENKGARKFYEKFGFSYGSFHFPEALGGTAANIYTPIGVVVLQMLRDNILN